MSTTPEPFSESGFVGAADLDRAQGHEAAQREIERMAAEQALREREAERHRILTGARCLLWYADIVEESEGYLRWKFSVPDIEAARRFLPITSPDGPPFEFAWYLSRLPEDRVTSDAYGERELRAGRNYRQEFRCRTIHGDIRWILEDVQVEVVEPGSWRAVGVCIDITERKELEAERHYILKSAHCLLWSSEVTREEDGRLTWTMRYFDEEAAQRLVPIDAESGEPYIWAWHNARFPEDKQRNYEVGDRCVRAGQDFQQEFRMRAADGTVHWLHEDVRVEALEAGRRWQLVGVCLDITEQKQRQAQIERLNARLQRSIRETHHRVKNNLQIVSAMLDMQKMQHEEAVPISEIERIRGHIRGLATIHDLLTQQAKNDTNVDTLSCRDAIQRLMPVLAGMAVGREIAFSLEELPLPVRQATTLTVLVNELVSNAFKHGQGQIGVRFALEDTLAVLEVSDRGPGFPEGFSPHEAANTGLELVESLARYDLNGNVCYENRPEGGGKVQIRFPVVLSHRTEGEP